MSPTIFGFIGFLLSGLGLMLIIIGVGMAVSAMFNIPFVN